MQIVSKNNLHEMSDPVFWDNKKNVNNLSSAELAQRVVNVNPCPVSLIYPAFANSVDPDQLASEETN